MSSSPRSAKAARAPPDARGKKRAERGDAEAPARRSARPRKEVDYTGGEGVDAEAREDVGGAAAAAAAPRAAYTPRAPVKRVAPEPADPESRPRNAKGDLVFEDEPEFTPRLTPRQVIAAGTWGGCYFNPRGGKPGLLHPKGVAIDHREFPASWFAGLPESRYNSRKYNVPTNKYGVKAGQDQVFWEQHGWINAQDPRGWFQWYCRFYLGRRTADDARQISRWAGVTGAKGRWKRALLNKIVNANAAWDDAAISPVIRQTLLHWAYEVTEADVLAHAK